MKYILIVISTLIFNITLSQEKNPFQTIDEKMSNIPEDFQKSTFSIAKYINSNFKKEEDKIRAIYYWVTSNIVYDIENIEKPLTESDVRKRIEKTLETKKGLCMNYSEVFQDISNKVGIECVFIGGYTKKEGVVSSRNHAWCGAKIDNFWYVFDPTWGAGFVKNDIYTKKMNNIFFKTNPEESIKTHMPFDYMYQFLNYPISNEDFIKGKTEINKSGVYFDFSWYIENQKTLSNLDILKNEIKRIEKSGIKNELIENQINICKQNLAIFNMNNSGLAFIKIADEFNLIVKSFQSYIEFKNKQFTPIISDNEVISLIEKPKKALEKCKKNLSEIGDVGEKNISNVNLLKDNITELTTLLLNEEKFINSYISTPKTERLSLFYKKL